MNLPWRWRNFQLLTLPWSGFVLAMLIPLFAPVGLQRVDAAEGTGNDKNGWSSAKVDLLRYKLTQLMVKVSLDDAQLEEARRRTAADVNQHQAQKQNDGNGKTNLRIAARALWLQLNLEYQAYLAQTDKNTRKSIAAEIENRYNQLAEIIWHVPTREEPLTLLIAGENMSEWAEAWRFAQVIYSDVKDDFPPEVTPVKILVRRFYFSLLSPASEEQDPSNVNRQIRETYANAFNGLQALGKAAVAAKVQAAVVMRRFYGSNPNGAYRGFRMLEQDRNELFPEQSNQRDKIHQIVQEVSTGGAVSGIVENYRDMNIAIAEQTAGKSQNAGKQSGWDGLLAKLKPPPKKEQKDHPNTSGSQQRSGKKEEEEKEHLVPHEVIVRLDRAYGFPPIAGERPQGVVEQVSARLRIVPLRHAMKLTNKKAKLLARQIQEWATRPGSLSRPAVQVKDQQPLRRSLDQLLLYDSEERAWFTWNVESACEQCAAKALAFSATYSGNLTQPGDEKSPSQIPDISLPANAPPTAADLFIRTLAATDVVAGDVQFNVALPQSSASGKSTPQATSATPPQATDLSALRTIIRVRRTEFGVQLLSRRLQSLLLEALNKGQKSDDKAKIITQLEYQLCAKLKKHAVHAMHAMNEICRSLRKRIDIERNSTRKTKIAQASDPAILSASGKKLRKHVERLFALMRIVAHIEMMKNQLEKSTTNACKNTSSNTPKEMQVPKGLNGKTVLESLEMIWASFAELKNSSPSPRRMIEIHANSWLHDRLQEMAPSLASVVSPVIAEESSNAVESEPARSTSDEKGKAE